MKSSLLQGHSRRQWLNTVSRTIPMVSAASFLPGPTLLSDPCRMRFGLVTYQWGKDWDLPTLLFRCQQAGVLGVELRTTHAHGVEPTLSPQERREVRQRFLDSPVTLLGPGSNERFDHPDPQALKQALQTTQKFIQLSHDIGGTGVKVKPDSFHPNIPREETIEQIGKSLMSLGDFARDLGQQIRLEVHGQCAPLPIIRQILDIADHPNVVICWNSNPQDLQGKGLESNFRLVQNRLGETVHVHELDHPSYPYNHLVRLLQSVKYSGWVLLEASSQPEDPVHALIQQRRRFENLL